jgi:hypothetical protein
VNGKKRGDFEVSLEAVKDKEAIINQARLHPKISPYLAGVERDKVIWIPPRNGQVLINFVL